MSAAGRKPRARRRRLGAANGGANLEAAIIVILGFLVGGIPAAVIHHMVDSKWPSSATSLSGHPKASKKLDWPLPGRP